MADLGKLDALAAAATPGPWHHGPLWWEVWLHDPDGALYERLVTVHRLREDAGEETAAYIAAAEPTTIRALIAVVRAAEVVRDWADDGQCKWCLAWAGSLFSHHENGCPVGELRAAIDALETI